jgi:hypothetical protein
MSNYYSYPPHGVTTEEAAELIANSNPKYFRARILNGNATPVFVRNTTGTTFVITKTLNVFTFAFSSNILSDETKYSLAVSSVLLPDGESYAIACVARETASIAKVQTFKGMLTSTPDADASGSFEILITIFN